MHRRTSCYYHACRKSTGGSRSSTLRQNSFSKASDMVRISQDREVKSSIRSPKLLPSSRSSDTGENVAPPVPPRKKQLQKTISCGDVYIRNHETSNRTANSGLAAQKGRTLGPRPNRPRILKKVLSLATLPSQQVNSLSASWDSSTLGSHASRTTPSHVISAPLQAPLDDDASGDQRLKRRKAFKRKPSAQSLELCSSQVSKTIKCSQTSLNGLSVISKNQSF